MRMNRRELLKLGLTMGGAVICGDLLFFTRSAGSVAEASRLYAGEFLFDENQIGFIYDESSCINCKQCENACQSAYGWKPEEYWRKVREINEEADKPVRTLSMSCNHCTEPACMKVCPVSAYTKRTKDGIVIQDEKRCIGCKYCMQACPYQVPKFNAQTGVVQKCHFCWERQDQGQKPLCVGACPTGALSMGKLSDLATRQGTTPRFVTLPDPKITHPNFVILPRNA